MFREIIYNCLWNYKNNYKGFFMKSGHITMKFLHMYQKYTIFRSKTGKTSSALAALRCGMYNKIIENIYETVKGIRYERSS